MEIGFIGLGIMGRPMAGHLKSAGHRLALVQHRSDLPPELVEGAVICGSAREVAQQSDTIILMVPDTPDVEQVLFGANGVAEGLRAGKLIIDMSSIDPIATREFAARIRELGCDYLDAPVSGGEVGAKNASLTIMCGGEEAAFERARPLFERMGKNITHVGGVGDGQVAKVANQIIVAGNLTALGEALTLARKAGLDRALTLKALGGGLAGSRALEQKTPNYVSGEYKPGFKIDLHFKDLGLIMEASRALGVPLPATAIVQELFNALRVRGKGGLDHSGIITLLEELAGVGERA